jgi:hypothetical protein
MQTSITDIEEKGIKIINKPDMPVSDNVQLHVYNREGDYTQSRCLLLDPASNMTLGTLTPKHSDGYIGHEFKD